MNHRNLIYLCKCECKHAFLRGEVFLILIMCYLQLKKSVFVSAIANEVYRFLT